MVYEWDTRKARRAYIVKILAAWVAVIVVPALVFGVMVVFLIVLGSMWIMDHLAQNMMPMEKMMQMQP